MPPAARILDMTNHPGMIQGPGSPTVTIEGIPAAVMGDTHACGFPSNPPHPPSPIVMGSSSVTIGGMPAVRVGDGSACGATVVMGAATVSFGG